MAIENYLLSIQGSVVGQYRENVLCFQSAGLATNDTAGAGEDLITAFVNHGQALWLACLPPTYEINLLSAARAFPKPSVTSVYQYDHFATPGTRGTNATAYNLCPVVFLVPPMGTKSGGKVFMPAVSQGDVLNNQPQAGYITALTAFFNAARTGFAGSGTNWQLAVYSRKLGSASLCAAEVVSARLGFQGRRRRPAGAG